VTAPDAAPRPRLPDLALAPIAGGEGVPLRVHRRGAVLVLLDGAPDAPARDFLAALAGAAGTLADWDARMLVVVGGGGEGGAGGGDDVRAAFAALASPFPALADPRGRVAAAAGVAAPALVVADQWGEVHWAAAAGGAGAWPPVAEVEQWARFLAIRCAG
jgi:hypothetical protein